MYLSQDIRAFVMYCVYGESRSSLLIESNDSMVFFTGQLVGIYIYIYIYIYYLRSFMHLSILITFITLCEWGLKMSVTIPLLISFYI